MSVAPDVQGVLDVAAALAESGRHPTIAEVRTAYRQTVPATRPLVATIPLAAVEDASIPGAAGAIPARIYRPISGGQGGTTVFFHGGGFIGGSLASHDSLARRICHGTQCVVVSVAYRLAPQHPWPAAVDDALVATRWVAENINTLGGDSDRLAIAGESAGGNLAAVVAQDCRDARAPRLCAQLLLYPQVDLDPNASCYPSRREHSTGYLLSTEDAMGFANKYAGLHDRSDPRISPVTGNLAGLPPTVVATAEYDPLRDEGQAYANAMSAAGVSVAALHFDGLTHGFFALADELASCREAADVTCAAFSRLLARCNGRRKEQDTPYRGA